MKTYHCAIKITLKISKKSIQGERKKRKRVSIIDPLIEFVQKNYSNMKFIGMIGLRMAKFFGQRVTRPQGTYAEPILIWTKQ